MPALPWTTTSSPPGPDTECTVLAARLPLRTRRDLPAVLRWTWRIRRQLARTPGLLGYAAAPRIRDNTLWMVSAWTSRGDLARFDRTAPHAAAKRLLRPALRPTTLAVWTCRPDQLPVPWDEVHRRVTQANRQRSR
jgi:hypothetical protein